jgi:hypothetical protein
LHRGEVLERTTSRPRALARSLLPTLQPARAARQPQRSTGRRPRPHVLKRGGGLRSAQSPTRQCPSSRSVAAAPDHGKRGAAARHGGGKAAAAAARHGGGQAVAVAVAAAAPAGAAAGAAASAAVGVIATAATALAARAAAAQRGGAAAAARAAAARVAVGAAALDAALAERAAVADRATRRDGRRELQGRWRWRRQRRRQWQRGLWSAASPEVAAPTARARRRLRVGLTAPLWARVPCCASCWPTRRVQRRQRDLRVHCGAVSGQRRPRSSHSCPLRRGHHSRRRSRSRSRSRRRLPGLAGAPAQGRQEQRRRRRRVRAARSSTRCGRRRPHRLQPMAARPAAQSAARPAAALADHAPRRRSAP